MLGCMLQGKTLLLHHGQDELAVRPPLLSCIHERTPATLNSCKDNLKVGLEVFVDVLERKTLHAHHREDDMRSSLSSSAA